MKSLQTQYNLIKEGKGNKEVFVKNAKAQFPTIPNHYGFNETVNELKHKNILNETMLGIVSAQPTTPDWFKIFNESITEAKAEEKKPTKEVVDMETRGFDYKDKKNIDNVYGEEFLKGFYTEMNDPKNKDKTVEELKEIVAKNLAKDQLHYVKDGQFGTKGVGYTTEHPGLGTPKEAKGKYKSSGYGDLKENKSIKEIGMFHDPVGYDKNAKSQIEVAREILTNAGLSKDEIDDFISNNMFKKGRLDDKAREFVNLKENQSITGPEWDSMDTESRKKLLKSHFPKLSLKFAEWKWNDLTPMIKKSLTKKDLKENQIPQFKVGDKVTYLGHPGKITGINKEMTGAISYNVSYDKGTGKTTASNIYNKDGEIEPLNEGNENTLMDIKNQLLDANIGDMAYGGGYGPFEKVTRNTWKNTKTGSLQHSRALADFIGGFSDFKISSSTNESKLRSAIRQFIKEELNRESLNEYNTSDYIEAVEYAQKISAKEGVVQHVNELPDGSYEVSDWYDSDSTVISFEDGREL